MTVMEHMNTFHVYYQELIRTVTERMLIGCEPALQASRPGRISCHSSTTAYWHLCIIAAGMVRDDRYARRSRKLKPFGSCCTTCCLQLSTDDLLVPCAVAALAQQSFSLSPLVMTRLDSSRRPVANETKLQLLAVNNRRLAAESHSWIPPAGTAAHVWESH